jgi:hypothetical protein
MHVLIISNAIVASPILDAMNQMFRVSISKFGALLSSMNRQARPLACLLSFPKSGSSSLMALTMEAYAAVVGRWDRLPASPPSMHWERADQAVQTNGARCRSNLSLRQMKASQEA